MFKCIKSNNDSKYNLKQDEDCDRNLIKLTDVEKLYLILNKFGDSIVMVTALVENTDLNYDINKDLCIRALEFLQRRHPFLRAYLTEDTNLKIQTGKYCPLEIEWSDNSITYDELISELEAFNTKQFDYNSESYLARSKIASYIDSTGKKMFAINLSMSLILTDGINITVLIIELINILNALAANKS